MLEFLLSLAGGGTLRPALATSLGREKADLIAFQNAASQLPAAESASIEVDAVVPDLWRQPRGVAMHHYAGVRDLRMQEGTTDGQQIFRGLRLQRHAGANARMGEEIRAFPV